MKNETKALTKKQREILTLVYRFRFVTAHDVARYVGQEYSQSARKRLGQLVELGYLAKRQNSSYYLLHRSVEYYATAQCIKLFRELIEDHSNRELNQIYVRPQVSDRFVLRSVNQFSLYIKLRKLFGNQLRYTTKPQLNIDTYDYFPQPLPDGFMTIKSSDASIPDQHFFVEYFDEAVSIGIHSRQIRKYIQYEESGDWDATDLPFPTVLIICQTEQLLRFAQKRVRYICETKSSNISFLVMTADKMSADKISRQSLTNI